MPHYIYVYRIDEFIHVKILYFMCRGTYTAHLYMLKLKKYIELFSLLFNRHIIFIFVLLSGKQLKSDIHCSTLYYFNIYFVQCYIDI